MTNPHKRQKQPQLIRQKLLESTLEMMASSGIDKMSLNTIADKTGVTKGGLLHHFPSKNELIVSAVKYALSRIDEYINQYIEADQDAYGKFTRAYIRVSLEPVTKEIWNAFSYSLLTDKELYSIWDTWLDNHLHTFKATDHSNHLEMIRYTSDGIWLKHFVHGTSADACLIQQLIDQTKR